MMGRVFLTLVFCFNAIECDVKESHNFHFESYLQAWG